MEILGDYETAALDEALAEAGEDVVLRRVVGVNVQNNIDVTCRAFVRQYTPQPLVDTIIQGDSLVIMSATQILAAQWPGGLPVSGPAPSPDPRVPRKNDKILVAGRIRNVEAVAPTYLSNQLVRLDIQVRG